MKIEPKHSNLYLEFKKHSIVCNSKNPKLIGYVRINNGVVEITRRKTVNGKLWFVKVVKHNKYDFDLSTSFKSYEQIEPYLYKLNYEDMSQLKNLFAEIQ